MLASNNSQPINIVYLWGVVQMKVAWNYCKYTSAVVIVKALKNILFLGLFVCFFHLQVSALILDCTQSGHLLEEYMNRSQNKRKRTLSEA